MGLSSAVVLESNMGYVRTKFKVLFVWENL